MKKFVSNFKMGEFVAVVGAISFVFTLALSTLGIVNLNNSNQSTQNIYEYYGWSNQVDDMKESILQIAINVENASHGIDNRHIQNIEKYKAMFMDGYKKYTSTDSDENEMKLLNTVFSGYTEYTELVEEIMNEYMEGDASDIVHDHAREKEELEQTIGDTLNELEEYLHGFAENDYTENEARYERTKKTNIVLIVVYAFFFISLIAMGARLLKKEMDKFTKSLEKIADGNLDVELISMGSRNEISLIKDYVNKMMNNFSGIIGGLQNKSNDIDSKSEKLMLVSEELLTSINNIYTAIDDVSKGTGDQASDMLEVSSILNDFSEKIDKFADNIEFLNNNSNEINSKANSSNEKMNELIKSFEYIREALDAFMERVTILNSTIDEISSISNLINDISEQTNLLALNAAIESARVGEAGKGFAVVAEEIGKLADESKKSSNNINSLIENIAHESQKMMNDGDDVKKEMAGSLSVIDEAVNSFKDIINSIEEIVPKIELLSRSSEEISREKDVIYGKIENSTAISEEISASCEEVSASVIEMKEGSSIVADTSNNLSTLTNEMNEDIKVFKI